MHVPALLLSNCCRLCQDQGILGMWKINLGQDTTMLDSLKRKKQTNNKKRKSDLLERIASSIYAIGTLWLTTLQKKINLPLLALPRKYIQNFLSLWSELNWRRLLLADSSNSLQAPHQSTGLPSIMYHCITLECRSTSLLVHSNYVFPLTHLG